MLIILTSPSAIAPQGTPSPDVVAALIQCKAKGHPVGVVSNHAKPDWFDGAFGNSGVQFLQALARQNGSVIVQNAATLKLKPHDVIVLVANQVDMQMAKNGGAVMVAAAWAGDKVTQNLGVLVKNPAEFLEVVDLTNNWNGAWWFAGNKDYGVRALADLSSMYGENDTQVVFANKLKNTVKNGGPQMVGLLTTTARSLLTEGVSSVENLLWGVYPSSKSQNNDTEVLSDFTHRLRTISSRVRMAARGEPLFIRHKASPKRSQGGGGDRTDPSSQIETIHINPYYKKPGRLAGKHVIVIDDCTTYGVSFGVAAALLRRAGVAGMTGVALGKFGNRLASYNIDITSDPYSPIKKGGYQINLTFPFVGNSNQAAKTSLQKLIT